jgi:hypothetical protein
MAPEYLREGRCDTASDVFSLAGSLTYATTGNAPFGDGTGVDVMHRVAFEEPKPEVMAELAAADPALAELLSACLTKDPAGRPTPRQLLDAATAAGHGHANSWPEPLGGRLLSRQRACEVLEQASAEQTLHFRAPAERAPAPAPGPAFGPATPPDGHGAFPQTPLATGNGENGPRRSRRKPYLAVVAGVAVVAVAVSAFLLTRSERDEPTSASPTTSSSTAFDDEPTSASPTSPSPSPSEKESGKEKEEGEDQQGMGGAADSGGDASGTGGTTGGAPPEPTLTVTATPGGGSGGDNSAAPTKAPTKPAAPPWITQCTHYSGTELTRYGDKNNRVTQVQCMLEKRGFSVGSAGVDGQFGDGTLAAVKQFQSAKGLDSDGLVGPNTWAALRSST